MDIIILFGSLVFDEEAEKLQNNHLKVFSHVPLFLSTIVLGEKVLKLTMICSFTKNCSETVR